MMLRRPLLWLALTALIGAGISTALAQRPDDGSSFMAQFPEGDIYRVQVIGDAFAESLAPILADVVANERRLQVLRRHRPVGALVRPEWEDDVKAEEANREVHQVAVLMLGQGDKQSIRVPGASRPIAIGSDDWKDEYAKRFERLVRAVKKRNTAVYVIGQPILRSAQQNAQAEILSDIMRQRAAANGARFIDIYETYQDDGGGYSQFGPDMSGNRVKLRESDGISLTGQGNRKLAMVIEGELKRDIEQAASDRAIALAGDEAEQKRINPNRTGPTSQDWKGTITLGSRSAASPQGPGTTESSGDQKADNSRITLKTVSTAGREELSTIEIVRPAIPAAVISLLNRREAAGGAGERTQSSGDGIVEEVGNGLTVVNSVASLADITALAAGTRRRAPVTQSAFYQVLIKGERMPPKPGRADDFTWPRPDPFATTSGLTAPGNAPVTSAPNAPIPGPQAPRSMPAVRGGVAPRG